jgi:hypothetical protein
MNRLREGFKEFLKFSYELVSCIAFDFPGGLRCLRSLSPHLSKEKVILFLAHILFEKEKEKRLLGNVY